MSYAPPKYPSEIPSIGDLPDRVDDQDWLYAARYNELKKELRACLTELGALPKGDYATVRARLDAFAPLPSKARAYKSATTQSLATDTWTKVVLDAISFDALNEFDETTHYRFTAQTAGYYAAGGSLYFLAPVAAKVYQAGLYKNDNRIAYARSHAASADHIHVAVWDVVYLAVDDHLELWGSHEAGVNKSIYNSSQLTFFSIHRLS